MQFNLDAVITNVSGTTTVLSKEQLESFIDGTTSSGVINLSSGDEISVVCDLYNRYNVDTVKYYYGGSGTVNIFFAESFGVWEDVGLENFSGGEKTVTTQLYPRWVKITHSTETSSSIYEIEIINEDSNILFGDKGTFLSYGLDSTGETVQPVQVFNNTSTEHDFYVLIDSDESETIDEYITVGTSSSGVFYSLHENGKYFPDYLDWNEGVHDGTYTTVSGHLTISGVLTEGTYFSPVFYVGDYENMRFFWECSDHQDSSLDYTTSIDSTECFGVRQYHLPPEDPWVDGELASVLDEHWSVVTGDLVFEPIANNSIFELRNRDYVQFSVTLSGSVHPFIYKAGVEQPVVVSGISCNSYKNVYIKLKSSCTSGRQANLICWYKE